MKSKNNTDRYIDHINSNVLPFIDYYELQASYETDMAYAKGVLNLLHEAMTNVYGSDRLTEQDGDGGFVVVPGVVRGSKSGKMCLALLGLDLSSSGEHWQTDYLCKYGVISQDGGSAASNNKNILKSEVKEINGAYIPYDYCYTASIPCDIHVNKSALPEEIKQVLDDFPNHRADLMLDGSEDAPALDGDEAEECEDGPDM